MKEYSNCHTKVSRTLDNFSRKKCQTISLQKNDSCNTIQRLIIRARDASEIFSHLMNKSKGTIYKSTFNIKKRRDIQSDSTNPHQNDDIGIGQISNTYRKLDANEKVIIVSHGSKPRGDNESVFADRRAHDLAEIVKKITPNPYTGDIYLDGCYTGRRNERNDNGTSYIERFDNDNVTTGSIIGNVGTAGTSSTGKELIEIKRNDLDSPIINPLTKVLLSRKKNGHLVNSKDFPACIIMMYDSFIADPQYTDLRLYIKESDGTAKSQGGVYTQANYTPID